MNRTTTPNAQLVTMARERVAELELDLHRWRGVLALAAAATCPPPAPPPPPARPVSPPRPRSPIEHIISVVAGRYGVSAEQLIAHDRTQPATTARQVAMRLARELTGKSYPEIGRAFDRDHATVMHACEVTATFALGDLRDELAEALRPTPDAEGVGIARIAG